MTEDQKRKFGARLRGARKNQNFSQADVAEFLNVSRQAVSLWEKGVHSPSVSQLTEFCVLFCCCANTLLFGESHQEALLKKLMPHRSMIDTKQEIGND